MCIRDRYQRRVHGEIIGSLMIGALISGLNIAYSQSNSCGVLLNVRDYIAKFNLKNRKDQPYGEDSVPYRAALAGGAYGLAMRETFALSFVLIFKTVCVLCVVCTAYFNDHMLLAKYLGLQPIGAGAGDANQGGDHATTGANAGKPAAEKPVAAGL
eukprot:TRINITY_DN8731_c0_g1_i1.p1 TRINITY_DN8731_c0_g1~~TRINITY_DN8731_c0_g1_i1.p1  ORF type:complete len:156 (+),score=35.25 TRINITY_DN8731_c0_g1_i1:65-532(+)